MTLPVAVTDSQVTVIICCLINFSDDWKFFPSGESSLNMAYFIGPLVLVRYFNSVFRGWIFTSELSFYRTDEN